MDEHSEIHPKRDSSDEVGSSSPAMNPDLLSRGKQQLIELQSSELVSIERISPNRSDNMNHDEIDSNSSDIDEQYVSSNLQKNTRSEGAGDQPEGSRKLLFQDKGKSGKAIDHVKISSKMRYIIEDQDDYI